VQDADGDDNIPLINFVQRWTRRTHPVNLNRFTQGVGPTHDLEHDDAALAYFYLMFSEDVFEDIAEETNRYAEVKKQEKQRVKPDWTDPTWFPTTALELKAYFGLMVLMGVHRLPQYKCYWAADEYLHVEAVAQVMSKAR
jgi:hypothetical protein